MSSNTLRAFVDALVEDVVGELPVGQSAGRAAILGAVAVLGREVGM